MRRKAREELEVAERRTKQTPTLTQSSGSLCPRENERKEREVHLVHPKARKGHAKAEPDLAKGKVGVLTLGLEHAKVEPGLVALKPPRFSGWAGV